MTERTNLVPKRRFKEFPNTQAWEQRKLGEMSNSFEYGLNASATFFDGINKYIRITDIDDKSRLFNQSALTSPDVDLSNADDYLIKNGDILFARTGASVGKTYRYQESDGKVYYAGFLIRARINQDFDSEFVFQNTLTPKYDNFIKITSQRSGQPGVNAQEYASFDLMVPTLEEQQKIGNFFKVLDGTIALHKRKLEKTKALKSAYLSEMFPAKGEREPKRRFAGFTQAWEQRKFIELLDVKDGIRRGPFGSALKKDLFVPQSDYVVYEQQNAIYDKWETRYNITKEKFDELHKFILSEGDFIMSGAGTIGRIAKVPKGIKHGVFNQALIRFKINQELMDSDYFLEWMRSDNMQRQFTEANPGSAMTNLVPMSEVKEWVVSVPSLAEQKKIGAFFTKLSDTIALHQRKLEKLQNIKKAYLNEMFV